MSSPYEYDRRVLPYVLNQRQLWGPGVEVGVCQGIFSEWILQHWHGPLLYLVDPWTDLPGYRDLPYDHEANYHETLTRMLPFVGRYLILRKTSLEAASQFEDGSLDFVYLDGDHRYEAVRADLEAWYPKVRRGGMLAGDDYGFLPEQSVDFGLGNEPLIFGVKRAVDEFVVAHEKNVSIDWLANWEFTLEHPDTRESLTFQARNWWFIR